MSEEIEKIPQIRFDGFTEEWGQCKAKELFIPVSEKNCPELPVLSVTQDSGVVYRNEVGIDIKYDKKSLKNYKVVHPGDFVISLRSFQGGFELSDKVGIVSPAYTVFIPKQQNVQDNFFWKNKFKTFKFIESLKTVTFGIRDGKSISFSEFGDLKLLFPTGREEQKKVGEFFNHLDKTIALYQHKYDLLSKVKQGYLQKMFPEEGKEVPKIRFEGFTEEWEQRKFGELVEFYSGLTYSPDNIASEEGTFVLRSSNVKMGEIVNADNVYVASDVVNSDNIQVGDIVVVVRNGSRDLIGKHAQIKEKMDDTVIGAFMTGIRSNKSNFINALLDTQQFKIEINKNLGATINQITTGVFKQMIFLISKNIEEQQKIGVFFKQLDNTIALHQRELVELKDMKKTLLKKMFA